MLAVVALIAVAMVVLSIGIGRYQQRLAEENSLKAMVQALRAARVQAIVSGQPARARFDLVERSINGPGQPTKLWPESWQVQLSTAQGLGQSYQFFPDGSASGGNLTITGHGRQWRIDVNWLTGVVQLRTLP